MSIYAIQDPFTKLSECDYRYVTANSRSLPPTTIPQVGLVDLDAVVALAVGVFLFSEYRDFLSQVTIELLVWEWAVGNRLFVKLFDLKSFKTFTQLAHRSLYSSLLHTKVKFFSDNVSKSNLMPNLTGSASAMLCHKFELLLAATLECGEVFTRIPNHGA